MGSNIDVTLDRCHLGQTIVYDTVAKFNWGVDIRRHSIAEVIEHILDKDWDPDSGIAVPKPTVEEDCVVSGVVSRS